VALGGFLRFYQIGSKGLWLDEAFSIWMGRQPVREMLGWLVNIDQHPPLYYTLLHLWMILGDSAAAARSLSALFGALTIPVIYLLGHRLSDGDEKTGLLAALILALSPFHVRFAQEARMYTLLALNASLALYALVRTLTDPRSATVPLGRQFADLWRAWRDGRFDGYCRPLPTVETDLAWLGYIIFATATLLSHNTAVFFPIAANIFVLSLILARSYLAPCILLRNWLLAQAGVLLLWSPWLVPFVVQSTSVYREFWIPAPTWPIVAGVVGAFLSDFLSRQVRWLEVVWGLYALLALLGLVRLRRRPARLALLFVIFLTPFVGEWLVSLRRPIFYGRTLIWASIPLYLLLAAGIRQLRYWPYVLATAKKHLFGKTQNPALAVSRKMRGTVGILGAAKKQFFGKTQNPALAVFRKMKGTVGVLGAILMIATVNGLSLREYYVHFEKEQWDDAAAFVAGQVEPDDLILFNATWVQIPFDFYFRLHNRPVAERGVPVDLFERGILEPKMAASDLPRLRALIRGHERVWLVYSHDWYTDPDRLIPLALEEELDLLNRWDFYGLQVQLYGLR